MYRIGDFARLGHVSVKTLRFYDEIGVLRPAWTDPQSGYRYYLAAQVADLNRILAFKDLGLSLGEVVAISKGEVAAERLRELLLAKRAEAERTLVDARSRLDRIDASLERLDLDEAPPCYSVVIKQLAPRLVVSVRDEVPSFDHLVELFDEVDHHTRRHRVRGAQGALYHGCSGAALDCEALAFVGEAVPETDRVRLYELPAVEVASVVHAGPVTGAAGAYDALSTWVAANGLELAGTCLELYLGGRFTDAESVIEIQFPLRVGGSDPDVH
jgi:DNA-binding transcriptional MerR regulator